jgi:hypothetical protein
LKRELHRGGDKQGQEIKWIKARDTLQREFAGADLALRNGLQIKPEENEPGYGKEDVDRSPSLVVERLERGIERLLGAAPYCLPRAADSPEMLPVPEDDGERANAPERIDGVEAFCDQ